MIKVLGVTLWAIDMPVFDGLTFEEWLFTTDEGGMADLLQEMRESERKATDFKAGMRVMIRIVRDSWQCHKREGLA